LDELIQALFYDSDDALLIADHDEHIVASNLRTGELSGYGSDEITGLTLSCLFVRFGRDGSVEPFAPLDAEASNGDDDHGWRSIREGGIRRQDGTIRPAHIAAHRLKDSRWLLRFRDLSVRKLTEDGEWTFRSLVESAQDVIFICDVSGRFVYVNSAAAKTLGTTQDAVIGKTVDELFPPDVAARYRAGVEEVVRTGQTVTADDRLDLAGRALWFNSIVQPIRDREGRITAAQGFIRNVTGLKEAEASLTQNEERLRQITTLAKIGIFDHDHRTGSVYWSREARDIYGLDPERPVFFEHRPEVQRPGWLELLHPDDRSRALQAVQEAHQSEHGVFELEHRIVRPDGETRWVNARSQTFFEGEGETRRPVRTIGAVRDVTALKEAEQAIRGNEERLRQVTRVAKIGIFDHDHRTGVVYWSPEMRTINEWGAEEPVQFERTPGGRRVPADVIFPEDREQVEAAIRRAHESEDGLFDMEYRLVASGGIRWVRAQSQTFFEGDGAARQAVRTIGATVDITDRKNAEAERERLHAQLLQAQKMETVGRLAGGVAHDFNNMLNVIGGYAELALKEIDSASPLQTPLLEIQNASRRSADLTRQLLAFARKQPVQPKVVDLNQLIDGSLNMLRRLIGEDIQLEWLSGDLWPTRIDPAQVDQVLINLVVNARDAIAGHGHITVRTRNITIADRDHVREPWFVPGDYAALEVADDGRGIDEETKAHIFEPFFSTKGEGRGTGLGLATVYGIVKQNNGVITVDSVPGRGTTLSVFLPRVTDATVDLGDVTEEHVQGGSETLLLVEDEPMVLRLTARMLETLGYTVLSASVPAEAVQIARERRGKIDLLVTDMVMPEISGSVLADQLRSLYPGLRCLFVSGYFPESGRLNVQSPGEQVLQKPFTKRALAAKVREVLASTPATE
jgi:PAS domain S-box-containing protein